MDDERFGLLHGAVKDFVRWQLQRLSAMPRMRLPSETVAWQGFQTLGHRPEELLRAAVQLQQATTTAPDEAFPIIFSTLAGPRRRTWNCARWRISGR